MKAYSYARFSSDAQRPGTSIERQQSLAEKWCKEHNILLSTETFKDEAVSGFHGANLETGALSHFIARVRSGDIESGSYLILENLDRLTRLNAWQASGLLQDLVKLGIVVITLRPEMRFDHSSSAIDLLQAILHMDNAHKESVRKSGLGKDKWAERFRNARESGTHIGGRVSNWITLGKDKKYYLNENIFAVGRIFELCLEGYGSTAISQTLNAEGYKTFNKGERWGTTAVMSILRNRAAVGELAPKDGGEPIPNYFPAVVDTDTFESAQGVIGKRETGKVTKQSADFNVWGKLVFCGACGSSMHIIQRSKFRYLMCANRRYGSCEGSKNVRLDESEDVLMAMLLHLDAMSLVMPDPDKLNRELTAAEGRLHAEREKLAILARRSDLHPESETFANAVLQSEGRIKALKGEVERLTADLTGGEKLNWQELRARIDLTDKPTRRRVNAFLHRLGVQVRIAEGYLVIQQNEVRAMFAVGKNRIGTTSLDGGKGEIPDLAQANGIASGIKKRLLKNGLGYRGTLTVPNGRGTRRTKEASIEMPSQSRDQRQAEQGPDWTQYDEPLSDHDYEDEYSVGSDS